MLNIFKYAAIDIGSNAIRLLIANIIEEKGKATRFKKSSLIRIPIRLGTDVFVNGQISDENSTRMIDALNAFNLIMRTHNVIKYKACATSAMRESKNGRELVNLIFKKTSLKVDIIDGEEEAAIIAATDLHTYIKDFKTYLYVDVGGGSTEFSIIENGVTITSKSFKIGTVRLLNNIVSKTLWQEAKDWIVLNTQTHDKIELIGSGGNINKIFKMSGIVEGKPISYLYLSDFYKKLQQYTYEELITELDLNQDRADVILPATQIYLFAMKWSTAKDIYVPRIGLADGIIKSIYFNVISCYLFENNKRVHI